MSCRNYLRPGITAPVQANGNQFSSPVLDTCNSLKRAPSFQNSGGSTNDRNIQKDLSDSSHGARIGSTNSLNHARDSLMRSSICSNMVDLAPKVMQPDIRRLHMPCGSSNESAGTHHDMPATRGKYVDEKCIDVIDDDILEVCCFTHY